VKWKRILIIFIVFTLFVPLSLALAEKRQETTIYLNKKELSLNVQPQFSNDQLFVPMRPFLETFGADVGWDSETNKVTARWAGKTVVMGARHDPNEREQTVIPLQVFKGVTMIPIEFVADFLELEVRWNREEGIIEMESPCFILPERFTNKEPLPAWLENWVENARDQLDIQFRIRDKKLYLLGTFGEKTTGGYSVRISAIIRQEDALVAEIHYKDPPSLSTIQVITRPYDLVYVDLDAVGVPYPSTLIYKIRGLKDGKALPIRTEFPAH
jgi:hypothetical protein